jgi:DNA topoisomerase I
MTRGLEYVSDDEPGIRRMGRVRFRYVDDVTGQEVRDREVVDRIRALAVPPAWTDVWICLDPRGHIQATGRDARGRKQYRYHPDWRAHRDADKFDQLVPFGRSLGRVRKTVDEDLRADGLPFQRVVALVVALLDETYVRVGNDSYRRDNSTFGLTTLLDRHATVSASRVRLRFKGKGDQVVEAEADDRRLARLVRRCQELAGQRLFQFVEDGDVHPIRSTDVNEYLREASGMEATAKTFRTWGASVIAAETLAGIPPPGSERAQATTLNEVVDSVAAVLGNTRAVCRASYIHPTVIDTWARGDLDAVWAGGPARRASGLEVAERRLLVVLDPRRRRRARRVSGSTAA